jgi:hypothetical protein
MQFHNGFNRKSAFSFVQISEIIVMETLAMIGQAFGKASHELYADVCDEIVLACQTVNSAYCCDILWWLCEIFLL